MDELRYAICDVFADRPLAGNQLAVFSDARAIPEELMQPLARELNLSETTFVLPPQGGGDARLRIFTPTVELSFAGHPTLGSAWVLAAESGAERISLETATGTIAVSLQRDDGQLSFAWMSQPVPTVAPVAAAPELLDAVGVAESRLPVEVYDNGVRHAYVCLDSADAVATLAPDQRRLAALAEVDGVSCFAVQCARATSRMFAPSLGVPEDPATGSAAGPLAAHLVRHGQLAAGEELVVSQGAQIARPSTLHARVGGTPTAIESVEVGGRAVVVGAGRLRLP